MATARNAGTGGSALDAQYGSTSTSNTNEPLLLTHAGVNYLYLPGSVGNTATTASLAALNPTGKTTVRVEFDGALPNWVSPSATNALAGISFADVFLNLTTSGQLNARVVDAAVGVGGGSSTASLSFANGGRGAVAVTANTNGNVTFETAPMIGGTWTQLGAVVAGGYTGFRNGASAVNIGALGTWDPMAGRVYRVRVLFDGVVVFDADFSTRITSGGQTTFTEATGKTVTINRSTSGRKSVAVVRPVWLFGTDDWFQVLDSALVNFGANEDFTLVAVERIWATPPSYRSWISKYVGSVGTIPYQGYQIRTAVSPSLQGSLGDGTSTSNFNLFPALPTATYGSVQVLSMTRLGSNTTGRNNTTASTAVTASGASVSNSGVLRMCELLDTEVYDFIIIRRALSDTEIATAVSYLTRPSVTAAGSVTTTTDGAYTVHRFTGDGTLVVADGSVPVEYLVVAGGGAGGVGYDRTGGGGGAGGVVSGTTTLSAGAVAVTVGAGGTAGSSNTVLPTNGSNSSLGAIATAIGGGRGGGSSTAYASSSGGSGGGAVHSGSASSGTAGQGNAGGAGYDSASGSLNFGGGGGGGAGAAGGNASTSSAVPGAAGAGGSGVQWPSGSGVFYGGGGGGGAQQNNGVSYTPGAGGAGGGGAGANATTKVGTSGTANTGGGGGGGSGAGFSDTASGSGAGGSGVVIVRYLTSAVH